MKKLLALFLALALCLTFTACSHPSSTSGEVVEVTSDALILKTYDGTRLAVRLDANTRISGLGDVDGDQYKAAPHTGVQVSFTAEKRAGSVTAADGTKVKAYRPGNTLYIDAYLIPDATVLSDGTVLDMWNVAFSQLVYQTKTGVKLLREDVHDHNRIENMKNYNDLSETARLRVADFYAQQGTLYDLQAELERAWTAYQADPEEFSPFVLRQDFQPAAPSGERVAYFRTTLAQTISGNTVQETTLCTAFDRETGDSIPLAELFTCPESELVKRLLDLATKNGSGPADPSLKAEMKVAFRMEYLQFSSDSLWLEFPRGSLPSHEHAYVVSVPFTDECLSLLQPWAVPQSDPQ